jgi:hypothetical protein
MKVTKRFGMLLLGIWLIVTGLTTFMNAPLNVRPIVLGILAIVAGGLILVDR